MARKNVRKNARIDEHILDLFFEGRLNPATKLPKDATPAEVHAWFKAQEHRTLATAARRRAHYDVEEAGAAEYHDAEVARLEAELEAAGHLRPRGARYRKNPSEKAILVQEESEDDELAFFEQASALFDEAGIYLHRSYDRFLVFLDEDGNVRAAAALCIYDYITDDPPFVEFSVVVAPDQQRKGLAKRLVESVIDYARSSSQEFYWGDDTEVEAYVVNEKAMIPLLSGLGFEQSEADPKRWRRRVFARANPRDAHDAHADEVDDWVTIEECGCHACAPARMNPRAAKRAAAATGAYADLDSVTLMIENALANYGLSMNNILAVKFTRGGKSRAGACSYSPSINKCQIMFNGLAWPAFTEEQRLNTVLHEAAHAIQFLTTGTSDHGPKWQKIARSIGCTGDSCMTLEASQAMVDAYAEAKGLEKRKIITREDAEAARADFAVGDYVSFDHKRERWFGKIVSRGPMHATVMIQSPREGITGKIPYPSLQKEAPPRFAEKVAGVDKPAPGESLSAWQARTGRGRENPGDLNKYRSLARDDRRASPLYQWGALNAYRLGGYWTLAEEVPLEDLADVKAVVQSKARLRSVEAAHAEGKELPPVELSVYPDGTAWIVDGNHRLVAARKLGLASVPVTFTFVGAS